MDSDILRHLVGEVSLLKPASIRAVDFGWAVVVLILGFIASISWVYFNKWYPQKQKGPRSWVIVGSYFEARRNIWRVHDWLLEYFNSKCKTIMVNWGVFTNILTVDPVNVEYILKTNFSNYPKGKEMHERLYDILGNGIFNSDGETWIRHRKIAGYEFSPRKLRDFSSNIFREGAIQLMEILDSVADSGREIDFQDLVLRMGLDSICKITCGTDLGCLSPSLPDVPFARAVEFASGQAVRRQIGMLWKIKRALNLGSEKVMKEHLQNLHSLTANLIQTRRAEIDEATKSGKDHSREDLLSRFMKYSEGEAGGYNERDLQEAILNFVMAGRDSSAVTLSWFFYCVYNNEHVEEKIREESDNVFGQGNNLSYFDFANLLTVDSMAKMNYLHAAIAETIRLYPAVPRDGKYAVNDDTLPDGTKVKRGNTVTFVPYSMGRMEFLWGPDALQFKPERWLKNGSFQQESPFKFTAFQAGPRMCLGKDSAFLQMKMTATILLRYFRFTLVPGQVPHYKTTMVLTMLHGLKISVTRR
ncbi:hypothetical protein O6H91_03G121000 [Diphasiastrum complanatum]|uniref:Uncharacterized protein n=2 Tax=Diphasiastrum complanatum TaxID=34168 RepID=A0ACC2AFR1_DIPCM|nr:hypothetical protein O6H91_22G056500 [Diphasiastrum complanatum]KAJ7563685.1 hypothetical protein O6H91_03G121000 [Diphasiastrum complanatum]